jgi:hypothetical protein
LKVIDLQTNEVMAERIGYMMDRGQGDISGGAVAVAAGGETMRVPHFLPYMERLHKSIRQKNSLRRFSGQLWRNGPESKGSPISRPATT